jgi:hypothetical protein
MQAEKEYEEGDFCVEIDADFTLADVSLVYIFKPEKKLSLGIGGGIGWAFASADVEVSGPSGSYTLQGLEDDSFTAHAILGPVLKLSDRVFLRLATRFRWFEGREDDEVDREITLGVGFVLGS